MTRVLMAHAICSCAAAEKLQLAAWNILLGCCHVAGLLHHRFRPHHEEWQVRDLPLTPVSCISMISCCAPPLPFPFPFSHQTWLKTHLIDLIAVYSLYLLSCTAHCQECFSTTLPAAMVLYVMCNRYGCAGDRELFTTTMPPALRLTKSFLASILWASLPLRESPPAQLTTCAFVCSGKSLAF